jgi:hypothetical protein
LDPAEFESGDSNLYRYAYGSPANNVDPTGLAAATEDSFAKAFVQLSQKAIRCLGNFVATRAAEQGVYMFFYLMLDGTIITYAGSGGPTRYTQWFPPAVVAAMVKAQQLIPISLKGLSPQQLLESEQFIINGLKELASQFKGVVVGNTYNPAPGGIKWKRLLNCK